MPSPYQLPFTQAIDYFAEKTNLDTSSWIEGQGIVQQAAFTVAGAKGALLQDIREATAKAINDGISIAKFAKEFDKIADRYSANWELKGDRAWRAQLIYEQNLRQANAAGRYAQMTDPETIKRRPYWQWRHGDSRAPRPAHLALDNKVFPADSLPFFPPAGFNCFPVGTKVATASGWRAIETIQSGDLVLGGSGDFKPCLATHKNFFNGDLVQVDTNKGRFSVTPNHRILTLRGWIKACSLNASDVLLNVGKISVIDEIVRNIDQVNTTGSDSCVPAPVYSPTLAAALNTNGQPINLDIYPEVRDVKIKAATPPDRSHPVKRELLSASRFRSAVGVATRIEPVPHRNGLFDFLSNIIPEKRGCGFKLAGNGDGSRIPVGQGFSVTWVVRSFLSFHEIGRYFARNLFPLRISDVLASDRFASGNLKSVPVEQPHHSPISATPSLSEGCDGQQFDVVEPIEGFVHGAPLHLFDSLDDFIRWAGSHTILSEVVSLSQTLYTGTVYNLSVLDDESYCLPEAIVHNCNCQVFSLSQRDIDRENLTVEDLVQGQDLPYIDPSSGVTRTAKLEPDPGFDWKPDRNLTPERRAEILQNLVPELRRQALHESLWQPLMTEAEASEYTKDSYYADQDFYHGTSAKAAQGIITKGAKLTSSAVNTYGDGFYLAFDKDIAVDYAQQSSKPTVLTTKVFAQNPKKFRDSMEVEDFLDSNNIPADDSQSKVMTKLLKRQGFDAVEIGGNQILVIIFNKQQLAIFDSEEV